LWNLVNLKTLICSNNQITSINGTPPSLEYLDCSHNAITSLYAIPGELRTLDCSYNMITSLPAPATARSSRADSGSAPKFYDSRTELPAALEKLVLSYNPITSLDNLPSNLKKLYADGTSISALPVLPATLTTLSVNKTSLTGLSALPEKLQVLSASEAKLESIASLPASLKELNVSYNSLKSLPELPKTLERLSCLVNPLASLPALPAALEFLNANDCELSSLPALPDTLIELGVSTNNLTSLASLPKSLIVLNCSDNELMTLPSLPASLEILYCEGNHLLTLPELPAALKTLEAGKQTYALSLSGNDYAGWSTGVSMPSPVFDKTEITWADGKVHSSSSNVDTAAFTSTIKKGFILSGALTFTYTNEPYKVASDFGTWAGSGTASAKVDADSSKFLELKDKDGKTVDPSNYTVKSGSTVIEFKEEYLKTLAEGAYTFTAYFSGGASSTLTLTVKKAAQNNSNPNKGNPAPTGDSSHLFLWVALLGVSAAATFLLMRLVGTKRRNNQAK